MPLAAPVTKAIFSENRALPFCIDQLLLWRLTISTTDTLLQVCRITGTLNRDLGYSIVDVSQIVVA